MSDLATAVILEAGYQIERAGCSGLRRRDWYAVRIGRPTDMIRMLGRALDMLSPYLAGREETPAEVSPAGVPSDVSCDVG